MQQKPDLKVKFKSILWQSFFRFSTTCSGLLPTAWTCLPSTCREVAIMAFRDTSSIEKFVAVSRSTPSTTFWSICNKVWVIRFSSVDLTPKVDKMPWRKSKDNKYEAYHLDQGWATIFTRGPFWTFICRSRARFQQKMSILGFKTGLRGPYVAGLSWCRPSMSKSFFVANEYGHIFRIKLKYYLFCLKLLRIQKKESSPKSTPRANFTTVYKGSVWIKIEVILILFKTFHFETFRHVEKDIRHMWRKANDLDNTEIDYIPCNGSGVNLSQPVSYF